MVNIVSKIGQQVNCALISVSEKRNQLMRSAAQGLPSKDNNRTGKALGVLTVALSATSAQAAFNVDGLCAIAGYYKMAIGAIALIAIFLAIVNQMTGKNVAISEIAMNVLIGCAIAMVAPELIGKTGLTTSCS